jgi:hypothetical protein
MTTAIWLYVCEYYTSDSFVLTDMKTIIIIIAIIL